jgi:ABC-type dipeptide/oligopeptide/nickel transport system permease subunit
VASDQVNAPAIDPGIQPSKHRRNGIPAAGTIGLWALAVIVVPCFVTLPWSLNRYDIQRFEADVALAPPSWAEPMGTDLLGRSLLWRVLLGGAISLGLGACAAAISLVIGTAWGAIAGYLGGRIDAAMMRCVDVLYSLPYILLVVMVKVALQPAFERLAEGVLPPGAAVGLAQVVTLLLAIGGVSWLTLARVVRGQVLSLRSQPFVEAAHAYGASPGRVICCHLLPNLVGPIAAYAALTVPTAILQESFLSFLGIGVQAPLPSWGNLAADGLGELHLIGSPGMPFRWWLLVWPSSLLAVTLMALNLLGDALRSRFDPHAPAR